MTILGTDIERASLGQTGTSPLANETPPTLDRRLAIGGAEVGLCLTRLHHDRFTEAVSSVDPVVARLAARGFDHEARIVEAVITDHVGIVVHIERSNPDPYAATTNAMEEAVDVIIGGRIVSLDGSLVGAPDVLVKLDDGYAAVEIKGHFVRGDKGPDASVSALTNLSLMEEAAVQFRSHRKRDLFQVAHYWRILDSMGAATSKPIGGVIGSDPALVCLWVELDGSDPSILEQATARTDESLAAMQYGARNPTDPFEAPWWRSECDRCPWGELCHAELEAADDPTLLNRIGAEERASLAESGVTTIADIALLSPDDERLDEGAVVLQARARTHVGLLRRDRSASGLDLPSKAREVDFDIETYLGRIYLAGFLTTTSGESVFEPVIDWVGTDESERAFVAEMFSRLASYADSDTVVMHWTDYERVQLVAAGKRHGLSIDGFESVDDWFDDHALDLYRWTKDRFVSPLGFSLKTVAPLCGFNWRDDDPGGLQSEIWYEAMLAGDDPMRKRILEYNEDDVQAQLAIRRWITGKDDGRGPGSQIPSVLDWPLEH